MAGEEHDAEGVKEIYVTARSRRPSLKWKMPKKQLNNKALDAVGRSLIAGSGLTDAEIEKIVDAPYLYAKVKARAQDGNHEQARQRRWIVSPLATTVFGSLVLTIAGIVGFSYFGQKESPEFRVRDVQVPVTAPGIERPKVPPEPVVTKFTAGRSFDNDVQVEQAVERRVVRRTQTKPQPVDMGQSEAEFYTLTYAGDPQETVRGGRVIRVDIPRSTLFAMGVDLPLENESPTVKADLLVGPDGVTQAIRIVR